MKRLLLLFLLILSCFQRSGLPSIEVYTLDNEKVNLSDYSRGKVLIYVWSRTCSGHSRDLKELSRLVSKYTVISYAVGMTPDEVKESYKQLGIRPNFLTLVDPAIKFNDYYPIVYLPSSYLFENGKLIRSGPGLIVQ